MARAIVGILCLSSKIRYGFTSKNVPMYNFKSFSNNLHYKVGLKSASTYNFKDVYAVVEPPANETSSSSTVGRANLIEILGFIDDTEAGSLALQYKHVGYKRKKLKDAHVNKTSIDLKRLCGDSDICVTIDPPGCVDVDDAVTFKQLDKNMFEIGVHITDVDSSVKSSSTVDNYYILQPESIYSKSVIHAMPQELSTSICSLVQNSTKPVLSVIFKIDNKGVLHDRCIKHGSISVSENLTYETVNSYIKQQIDKWVLFNTTVCAWLLNDAIPLNSDDDAHRIIEFLMIQTNKYIAESLKTTSIENDIPVLLREHEYNSSSLLLTHSPPCSAKYVAYENKYTYVGHSALNLSVYTHFTSPIRRYADLIVHRQVKRYLLNIDTPYSTNITDTVDHLNDFQRRLRRLYADWSWWSLRDKLCDSDRILNGRVCGWQVDDDKWFIMIEFNSNEIKCTTWVPIFTDGVNKYASVEKLKDQLYLTVEKTTIRFFIDQSVCLQCWWNPNKGIYGLNFVWIDPNISNLFLTVNA